MLGIGNVRILLCKGHGTSRRNFLQIGLVGLSLPALTGLQSAGAVDDKLAKIKNCITIFLVGSLGQGRFRCSPRFIKAWGSISTHR